MPPANTPDIIPSSLLTKIETQILGPIVTLLALGAFILFAYGVFELIRNGGNEEARRTGRQHVLWGLVGLTVLFGATIIVQILTRIAHSSL